MVSKSASQLTFEKDYITSAEICKKLDVGRTAIHFAKLDGTLPQPISINGSTLSIWPRKLLEPFLVEWKKTIQAKRKKRLANGR